MNTLDRLQVGGTLGFDSVYIQRAEDTRLFELLWRGTYVNLLASRQMGKSSLILRTLSKLEAEGVRGSFIDLASTLGTPTTVRDYYLGLLDEISRELNIGIDLEAWWNSVPASATSNQKLRRFFIDKVLQQIQGPIVIALDEIDSTLKLRYTDDLFTALRAMYNDRHRIRNLGRITFCLIGVATPNELIKDRRTTPYNVGENITLGDFDLSRDDLSRLEEELRCHHLIAHSILEKILYWTGGQPYLTVRACADIAAYNIKSLDIVEEYFNTNYGGLRQLSHDAHIESVLRFVGQRLTDSVSSLSLYQRILLGEPVRDAKTPAHSELKLSGLVRVDDKGGLRVANRIYRKLFDEAWVESLIANPGYVAAKREAEHDLPGALVAYNEHLEILKRLVASDPNNTDRQRDVLAWQHKIGDLLVEMGDLTGGLGSYQIALAIAERLVGGGLHNIGWQRDLSVSHFKIGDVRMAQGDLAAALESYRASLGIRERLAATDSENDVWQRDLSISHAKIGDVRMAQGDLAGALESYRSGLAISERLASADPDNAGWQRDLSVSRAKIGEVQAAHGDLAGALESYRASLGIRERLAATDSENDVWQRDLSISHERIGEVQAAAGNFAAALESYRASLAISERLASADPENATWQRDLLVSHAKIGNVLSAQGEVAAALDSYRSGLVVAESLAAIDPANAGWQRDLSILHGKIGDLLRKLGELTAALGSYQSSLAIAERLAGADPANTSWQSDLTVSHTKIGDVLRATGDLEAASDRYQVALKIVEDIARENPDDLLWNRHLEVLRSRISDMRRAQRELSQASRASLVFLSYSPTDKEAALYFRHQLNLYGLSVFSDADSIRDSDDWLARMQDAVDECSVFVVLVGRDGVGRRVGAEIQAALGRYFKPGNDSMRLPIFPVLLGDTAPETLPAFLKLFKATRWNGADSLPEQLLVAIRERFIVANDAVMSEGCPFVGLGAYRVDQAHLFFGRQVETLDALASFDQRRDRSPVRWLQITGNSGVGKSSLMNAGLLPLIDRAWLWPRTGYAQWRRIGPMMPGAHPVAMLAEVLACALQSEVAHVHAQLATEGEEALAFWLRGRKQEDTAFLLAVDQFEELFTFADANERRKFDRLLAAALEDLQCPLFVLSTMRSDFLDRFQDDLPRLVAVLNRLGRFWALPPISADGLREVIDGPARLASLDVSEVKEAMVAEAQDEPGALPLIENALHWLWERRIGNRLSGQLFTEQGGLAGILSGSADWLLTDLDAPERERALELLFRLVQVDPEGRHHISRRIALADAVEVAGGGARGRDLVERLAGRRARSGTISHAPVRLITITEDVGGGAAARQGGWVNMIHQTLIRSKGPDWAGRPQPFWPTLWNYIEQHKERAARRERLQLLALEWKDRKGFFRLFGLAGWSLAFGFRGLAAPKSLEQRYLRWSRFHAVVQAVLMAATLGVIGESVYWAMARGAPFEAIGERWAYVLGAKPPLPHFVEIPAGSFRMGSEKYDYSKPVHTVTFARPFSLGATEVTFRDWDACVADGGCDYRPADQGWGRDTRPVINVSWQDAQAYVAWLSRRTGKDCRLPSEAEWEYAARAGTAREYALPAPNGSDDIKGKALANCADCGSQWDLKQTAPVGNFEANAWGLHDMHGNVSEWVDDCWHENYDGAPEDGRAWLEGGGGSCTFRVPRGGSWNDNQDNAGSADRNRAYPDFRSNNIGFRVVCSSPASGTDR